MPLSAQTTLDFGTRPIKRLVVPRSTSKLVKLRLLTPITLTPRSTAIFISAGVLTSTSGSMPRDWEYLYSFVRVPVSSILAISRTESAPASLASSIWYSSKMNSFRRIAGRFGIASRLCRTARRSSMLPLNHSGSVRTEITLAPAIAYFRAWAGAQVESEITPFDGDARLISAISDSGNGDRRNRSSNEICGGAKPRS